VNKSCARSTTWCRGGVSGRSCQLCRRGERRWDGCLAPVIALLTTACLFQPDPAKLAFSGRDCVRRKSVRSNRGNCPCLQLVTVGRTRRNKVGGPDRDRTGDLLNAIQARSQLRYRPTSVSAEHTIVTRSHDPAVGTWSVTPRTYGRSWRENFAVTLGTREHARRGDAPA
jgi:hypothetical protein